MVKYNSIRSLSPRLLPIIHKNNFDYIRISDRLFLKLEVNKNSLFKISE